MNDRPTKRFRATIAYDGTAFHGSQLQPDVRTVQGEIESALSRLFETPVRIDLAGRTDTGVHATAQEIALDAPDPWDEAELRRALAALLPDDLTVRALNETHADFHPRFDATARRYLYVVRGSEHASPFQRTSCWTLNQTSDEVDRAVLSELADMMVGERSFESFAKAGQPERGTRCDVRAARWEGDAAPWLGFEIEADRFLHHMVRYLVGTSIEVATGRRPKEDFANLLAGTPASRAVFPAPPHGLYLTGVRYADEWNRPAATAVDVCASLVE